MEMIPINLRYGNNKKSRFGDFEIYENGNFQQKVSLNDIVAAEKILPGSKHYYSGALT